MRPFFMNRKTIDRYHFKEQSDVLIVIVNDSKKCGKSLLDKKDRFTLFRMTND